MSRELPYWEKLSPATVIAEARTWVGDWEFIEIESIAWKPDNGASGLWYPPWKEQTKARISLGWDMTAEMLWHEVFHSVATKAPLIGLEPEWGEGWCCAFSDAMRGTWLTCYATEPEPGPDIAHRLYGFPASILARHVRQDAARLKKLWLDWNCQAKHGVLRSGEFSEFIGYSPKMGRYLT